MEFFSKPFSPPLIACFVNEFTVCGSGNDSRLWLKPAVIRQSTALVIPDRDGRLLWKHGRALEKNGYLVRVVNTADFERSAKYNPFEYLRDDRESDIAKLVHSIISGTRGRGKYGDVRFISAEAQLLTALIGYISNEAPEIERNIGMVIEMMKHMIPEAWNRNFYFDDDYKHAVDFMFESLEERKPGHLSVMRYQRFKQTAGSKALEVIESCAARLSPFDTEEARNYFSTDELQLNSMNISYKYKYALFVFTGKSGAFDFIVPLLYTQLFDTLC